MIARSAFLVLIVLTIACAPSAPAPAPATGRGPEGGATGPAAVQRTLVIIGGRAPDTLAAKQLRDSGGAGNPRASYRAFNAGLALNDERDVPRPYLAESLPQLNTDDWRVMPDGRMETTFRLKPDLTWHDGRPLTGEDFVFAHRVYSSPDFGTASLPPITYMDEVRAPDERTVVIRWRQPFAQANAMVMAELMPLPRHVLEPLFTPGQGDSFAAHPFWISEYVGLGPYRLTRYELGSFAEATAFAGHALGRPKIEQLKLAYMSDANTALANLLSDAGHLATDNSIDLQQAIVLDREWGPRSTGTVLRSPVGVRHGNVQLRPEYATPRSLVDLRVRRALAHATDRQALADALTEGMGSVADTLVLPQVEYFGDLERAVARYSFDPRRAEQLLNEAGYSKGSDGFLTSPSDGRFAIEIAVAAGARNESEVAIISDGLRRQGMDATIRVVPRAQVTEPFVFAHFSGVLNGSHNSATIAPVQRLRISEIATPENRGRGANYAGWVNQDAERLVNLYETTLNRAERNQHAVQLLKLVSEELPIYTLYYNLDFVAHTTALRGPTVSASADGSAWNLHEWYWER